MSASWDALMARVVALEKAEADRNQRDAIVKRDEQRIDRRIDRGDVFEVVVPLSLYDELGAAAARAPADADYLVKTAHASLSAGRVVTDTTSIVWDFGTAGQAKATRAALTGDVTASADDNATTIAVNAVLFSKMQDISTGTLIGRSTASTGDPEQIIVGAGLTISGGGIRVSQGASIADATGGVVIDVEARAALNALLARARADTPCIAI